MVYLISSVANSIDITSLVSSRDGDSDLLLRRFPQNSILIEIGIHIPLSARAHLSTITSVMLLPKAGSWEGCTKE